MRTSIKPSWSTCLAAALAVTAAITAPGCSGGAPVTATGDDPGRCRGAAFEGAPLSVRCGALVDASGSEVLLHGVNARVSGLFDVSFSDGRIPLEIAPDFEQLDVRNMRSMGFNALRLPLNWSGLEPTEDGGFAGTYMARIAEVVGLARDAGMFVLLDMHQDAYSKEIGQDGAPYWAIQPPPPARLEGPLKDLAERRLSKPVMDAFATFFGPSPDGVRLRSRFAKAAAHVAAAFANDAAVVGIEVFNEPLGTDEQIRALDAEVLAAVRAVAPKKLVFFQPSAQRNATDRASIPDKPLGPGTVYAPHIYTLARDGSESAIAAMTKETLRPSYANARQEADAWQAPLVVGEYGFSPSSPRFADYVAFHGELQDEYRASSFFWLWKEDSQGKWGVHERGENAAWVERSHVVSALSRLRLERVPGRLARLRYDRAERRLVYAFQGNDSGARNVISTGRSAGSIEAQCNGRFATPVGTGPIEITCGGQGTYEVTVRFIPR